MSTKYFALLTQLGADKLANAAALGTKIEITHMAVGDGGGSLPTPDTKQTKLINEKRRAAINTLSIDPKNTNQIVAEQVIPENEGGWWIREIGLYDKDGILIAVGNCAETYKPQLQEGSGRTQTIRMILIVSSADAVTLKVDPSVILATREYVDDSIKKHENSRNHPDATLKEKGFVILSSAVDSNSETHAATPKSVKAAYDLANAAANNANTRLEKNKNGADVVDKDTFNRNIGSARAFSGSINTGGGVWTTEEFIAWLKSQGAFNHPYWVYKGSWWYANNKRIIDTGCGSIHLAGAVVEVMGIESVMTIRVTTAPTSVDDCIPNAQFTYGNHGKDYLPSWRRDYNTANKPTASEVGAYSKDETDARVNAANENANSRLEKNNNGADIPNKDEFVKNLGLTETVDLAAGALSKSIVREVGNGGTFASCNTPGIYNIAIDKPETVSDFPKVNGNPIYGYGMMIVTVSHSCTSQLYMSHIGHIAVRQSWYPNKEYYDWLVQYSSANKPTVADVIDAVSINDAMRLTYLDGWENIYNGYSGFAPKASFLEKYNLPFDVFGVQLRFSNVSGASSEGRDQVWSHRLIFIHGGDTYRTDHINKGEIVTRKFWDTMNAKPDNSGCLRVSSPIVEIYSDGTCITNNESEGVTVTKLSIGQYKISGVLGFNSDKAWGVYGGISSPKDNNGLELIYIDDKVKKDGGITIEIFHRQHSHLPEKFQNWRIKEIVEGEKVFYTDGEPCDIPVGCRLDVRVQMPEDSIWNQK